MPDTIGDLARQDLYPDERYMQPPVNPVDLPPEAYASLGGGDLGLLGKQGLAGLFGGQSWLQKAQDVGQKDIANYQTGGVPAVIGSLADTSDAQDLAGGFGGNIKGVGGKVVPGALAALGEYHPPFYSAVERAVQDAKQNVAPGQQWAGYLRNQPGVKPEEVETLGLGKLFEQPTVSKDAVLGEIAANKVNVGEVVKSEQTQQPAAQRVNSIDDRLNDIQNEFDRLHQFNNPAANERRATLAAQERELQTERAGIVANWQDQASGRTKFSQWTLPGGENYREMLLTLPQKTSPVEARLDAINGRLDEIRSMRASEHAANPELGREFDRLVAERTPLMQQFSAEKTPEFKSSHYDEPNVLAHVRYNDRVIDGKKTLFVEEVQSDWHQKGKREGYQLPSEQTAPMDSEYRALVHKNADARARGYEPNDADVDRARELETALLRSDSSKIPDAPFKTTWPDLAMKRIIREAAEKGYDKVAWTPGSVQAARYPDQLRQHVDNISWSSPGTPRSNPEGLRYVHATPRAGGMDLVFTVNKDGQITEASANQAKGQHVEDIFGKDMARQIMEKGEGEIASKDFVIGAKGMEGFYDQILPATVNKLVKKHGARVEQARLFEGSPEKWKPFQRPDGDWSLRHVDDGFEASPTYPTPEAAYADLTAGRSHPVHSLDITPSLRAAAMKGFPLFTAGGVAATGVMSDLARQDEYQ